MQPTVVIKETDDLDAFEDLLKKYPIIGQTLNNSTNVSLILLHWIS